MYSIQTASSFSEAIHEVIKIVMLSTTLSYLKNIVTLLANSYTLLSGFLNRSALKGEKKNSIATVKDSFILYILII